jgi:hypothetical protein
MGQDWLIAIDQVERHVLEHLTISGAVGEEHIRNELIPIILLPVAVHSQ